VLYGVGADNRLAFRCPRACLCHGRMVRRGADSCKRFMSLGRKPLDPWYDSPGSVSAGSWCSLSW
jgi:hypothetical protein